MKNLREAFESLLSTTCVERFEDWKKSAPQEVKHDVMNVFDACVLYLENPEKFDE